tara:strand:+ start:286 stop:501 length:216 start_codon:yes stop_codon:yes gene_type:complete
MKSINIGSRVWKAIGHNYILFGTVVEETKTNGWAMVRVNWDFPPSVPPIIDEWQKLVNLAYAGDLVNEPSE